MTADRAALGETLEQLGLDLSVTEAVPWEKIVEARPGDRRAGAAYDEVNRILAQVLETRPLDVRHVTGEARALADPAHRRVLRAIAQHRQRAELACFFAVDVSADAWEFVSSEREHWGPVQWFDLIDMLALAAEGTVDVYRMREQAPVHFSVFGGEYVLLQSVHTHPSEDKWVWFIRSRGFADRLAPRLDGAFEGATRLDAGSFDDVLDWLHGFEIYETLQAAAHGAPVSSSTITRRLHAMGFIASDHTPTPLGEQWLEALTAH